jgi:hypothetical protein
MGDSDDEEIRTAFRLRDESISLGVDAIKLGLVIVAIIAIIPAEPLRLIHPAVFALGGAAVAALVIWRIIRFVNAISD